MNFGTLKDIFTTKLVESYSNKDNKGKELYRNFLKILKESETLKTAFIVFKNIESKTIKSEVKANEYIKESISLFEKFKDKNSLNLEIKKLTTLLESYEIDYKNTETKPLHKNLQNLITSPKNVYTLSKLQEAKEELISWVTSEKENINEDIEKKYVRDNINLNKFLDIATSKFNEKYKDSLTEEEKNILKVLRENNEEKTKTLVSELVKETISLVNQHLDKHAENVTIKSKLLETKDVIYRMSENSDSFSDKILKLYELKKNLKNG